MKKLTVSSWLDTYLLNKNKIIEESSVPPLTDDEADLFEAKNYWKTIILSDLHVGADHSQPEKILKFLENNIAETWILNGDIIDGHVLKRTVAYWTPESSAIIKKFCDIAKESDVIYNIGNHDEFLKYITPSFINLYADTSIQFVRQHVHHGLDGRSYFCFHGDVLDFVLMESKLLHTISGWSYNRILKLNRCYNNIRKFFKLEYHSFVEMVRHYFKDHADRIVNNFERAAAGLAKENGYDAAICGHIHTPTIQVDYMNSGDFCQNCTCLVEDWKGIWKIIKVD